MSIFSPTPLQSRNNHISHDSPPHQKRKKARSFAIIFRVFCDVMREAWNFFAKFAT